MLENVESKRRVCVGIAGSSWLVVDSGEPGKGIEDIELYCMRCVESREKGDLGS